MLEEEDAFLAPSVLSQAQALALYRHPHFDLEYPNPGNGHRYRLRSKGWVGHIPVVGLRVSVLPKTPVKSIFHMLEVAHDLRLLRILEGKVSLATINDLLEVVLSVLVDASLKRIRAGLYQEYVERSEDLIFVRGTISIRESIGNANRARLDLRCEHSEIVQDNRANQILYWALYLGSRIAIVNSRLRLRALTALRAMSGAISLVPRKAAECQLPAYHRLVEDYRPLHALSRIIVAGASPSLLIGDADFLPFEINMPKLFEDFVARWLVDNLPADLSLDRQARLELDPNNELVFQIDLVLRRRSDNSICAVLDTKYKVRDLPSEQDVQQVTAYATRAQTNLAFLVFPSGSEREYAVGKVRVRKVVFALAEEVDMAGRRFLGAITSALASATSREG